MKDGRTEHEKGGGRCAPETAGEGVRALARDVDRLAQEAAALEAAIAAELAALDAAFAAAATAGDAPRAVRAGGVLAPGRKNPDATPAGGAPAGDQGRRRARPDE